MEKSDPLEPRPQLIDVMPLDRYSAFRRLVHALVDLVPSGALLWSLRRFRNLFLGKGTLGLYPPINSDHHAALLLDAARRSGGYAAIHRAINWMTQRRFSVPAAAVLAGRRWFDGRVTLVGAAPPRGAIVVVPHLGLALLHQIHLLALGHSVVFPVYDPDGRWSSQWRWLQRLARVPSGAVLRIAHLPDLLFAFRAKRALTEGFTLTWQPDTFFNHPRATGTICVSLLGQPMRASPVIEKLAADTGAPVFIAHNMLEPSGAHVRMTYLPVPPPTDIHGAFTERLYQLVDEAILANLQQWTQWHSFAAFAAAEATTDKST